MNKLSVIVITYNEEANIRDCLKSVSWADEIVVVDSMSTDKTVEICGEFNAIVIQRPFEGYGRMRNIALAQCFHDWVLALDADERVSDELRRSILKVMKGAEADAYLIARRSHFLGRRIRYCGWYPDERPVLFNRSKMKYSEQLVHESVEVAGTIGRLNGDILHYPFRDLRQYFRKMDRYSSLRAEEMQKDGKRFGIHHLIVNPLAMFFRMYVAKLGFLDGKVGLILSLLYGYYYTMIKYVKLWEKQSGK